MVSATTEEVTGSTTLTEAEKAITPAEEKLYPKTPTGAEEKTAAEKEASDKATKDAADKAAAEKAAIEKKEEPASETKPPEEVKKPEEKTPAKPPTDYDLKLPDGSPLSAEDVAQTLKDAKAAGLTKEQAESLLNSKDQGAKALQTRQQEAFKQTQVAWKEAITKDPEMGGDKLAETTVLASRAFKQLASAELQIWAEKTGLGDYPEFVRLMARVGKMMGEDKLIRGTVGASPEPKSREAVLYGKTTPDGSGKLTP